MNTFQSLLTQSLEEAASAGKGAGSVVVPLIMAEVNKKADKASPTFTGTPLAPTPAADTNTQQLATTAFVIGQASAANPTQMKSKTPGAGTSKKFSREDHVHDIDPTVVQLKEDKNAVNGYPSLDEVKMLLNSQHKPSLKAGTGVQYNGVNSLNKLTSQIANGIVTFELFVNVPANNGISAQHIFSNIKDDATDGVIIGVNAAATFIFTIKNGIEAYSCYPVLKTGWHHIVMVITSISDIKIYIDGRLDPTAASQNTLTALPTSLQYPQIGARRTLDGLNHYSPTTATVAIARMYNYPLSAGEAANLWNGGRPNQYRLPYSFIGASNTEMVVNGGFDTDTIWNKSVGSAITGGLMNINTSATNGGTLFQQTMQISRLKMYKVTYTISNYISGAVKSCPGAWTTGQERSSNGTFTDYFLSLHANTSNTLQFVVSGSAGFVGSIDNVSVTTIGATLSLEAQNAYPDAWIDNSNLQIATPYNSPITKFADEYAAETTLADYNISASISGGKTFTIPAGYYIDQLQIGSKVGALSAITVSGNSTNPILSGKSVSAGSIKMFKEFADDQIISASDQTLTVTATGVDASNGASIVIFIKRKA